MQNSVSTPHLSDQHVHFHEIPGSLRGILPEISHHVGTKAAPPSESLSTEGWVSGLSPPAP